MAPGKTMAYFYQKAGLHPIVKSIPDRVLRKGTWHEYLTPFEYDREIVAKVRIFKNCEKLIETLPQLSEDEKDNEKVADCGFDHWYDGAGYGLVSYHLNQSRSLKTAKVETLPWALQTGEKPTEHKVRSYLAW